MNVDSKILDEIVSCLALYISKRYPNISIVRFGSSIYGKVENCMDIDILLITEENFFQGNFSNELNKLKSDLFAGIPNSNFYIKSTQIETIIQDFIKLKNDLEINFIPKFVFGPFYEILDNNLFNVYFHIKGPLTNDQFSKFCKKFPFHAKSILSNSVSLFGEFDKERFDKEIVLEKGELLKWINSMYERVKKTENKLVIVKSIKKILHLMNLYNGHYKNIEQDLFKFYPNSIDFFKLSISENSAGLKREFRKIYDFIIRTYLI